MTPEGAVALGALFVLAFAFAGSETAFSLQRIDREPEDWTSARIQALLARRPALASGLLLGQRAAAVGIVALATTLPGPAWLPVVVVPPALVLLAEAAPRVIARRHAQDWARLAVWPLSVFFLILAPIRAPLAAAVRALAWPFGGGSPLPRGLAEGEIRTMLERGGVDAREREIIEAVFEFDENNVGRLMIPRPDIFAVPLDLPWEELLRRCRETGFSRVPVYEGRLDHIVGVLLLKDLLKYRKRPPAGPRQLRSILWPPTFVPQTKPADAMLREFMERRFHMAFVVDEHGTLVGLLTLDDLLSELVGELLDPDDDAPAPEVQHPGPGVISVKAAMDIEDFDEETGIAIPEGEYTTVGGFVFHLLGRLPRDGDTVEHKGYRFTVAGVEGRRITEVRVEGVPAEGT